MKFEEWGEGSREDKKIRGYRQGKGEYACVMSAKEDNRCGEGSDEQLRGGDSGGDGVRAFSRKAAREIDRRAAEEYGIPTIVLMENAARGVAGAILSGLEEASEAGVLIVCGPGNNGGDGLAIARHLHNAGVDVGVVLVGVKESAAAGDAGINLNIMRKMGLAIESVHGGAAKTLEEVEGRMGRVDVVVDALLGTGVDRRVAGVYAEAIKAMNAMGSRGLTVVSVDLPSGMDADTGEPAKDRDEREAGVCVRADLTIALAGVKRGMLRTASRQWLGSLMVVDIGVPVELLQSLGEPAEFQVEGEAEQTEI